MKKMFPLLMTLSLLARSAVAAPATNNVAGDWHGALDVGTAKLRLVFRITNATNGGLTAKLDSLDQGARDMPVDSVTVSNKSLRMEIKSIHGLFVGTLDAAGRKATGVWSQGANALPLTLEKGQRTSTPAGDEELSSEDLAANKQAAAKTAGTWSGTLSAGGASLRLRVNISKTASGGATGTMDSLDQGANGIPLSAITLKDGTVRFQARGVGGFFEGRLSADGTTLTGEWRQGGQTFPLELKAAIVPRK